uniref:Uncharacterized protein n=1 Tax=Anguilla anguilla TaxID=7936 RepID=A0A0E9XBR9_ANGAN
MLPGTSLYLDVDLSESQSTGLLFLTVDIPASLPPSCSLCVILRLSRLARMLKMK